MTKFTSILRFFALLNILLQVNGEIVPNVQKYPTGITWENATKICGENGLEYDYNALKNVTDFVYGAEFWIGVAVYRIRTPWIEIVGCHPVPATTNRNITPTIALCKRFCGTDKYIGYKSINKECVCLGNAFQVGIRMPINNCEKQMGNAFFIYTELGDGSIATDSSMDGNCITLCCQPCNGRREKQQADCKASNPYIATRCEFQLSWSAWNQNYSTALESCFLQHQLLIPPTFCQSRSHSIGIIMWTNVFREEREEKLTQNEAGNLSPVRCLTGEIHQQEGQLMLNITERDCNTKIEHFVCVAPNTDTKQTLPGTTTTDTKSTHHFETSRPDLTSTQSDLSTPSLRKNTTHEATVTKNYEGIIAGISVITIGLLSGLTVLIVCRVRSLGVFKHTNRKHEDFSSMKYEGRNIPNKIENINPTSNNTYGLVADNSHDTYAKVKKKVNMSVPIVTSDDTYVESSYGEYDRLNVTNNTYDSNAGVRDMADPTYHTSKFNDRKCRESDMYDHSFQGGNSDYDYSSSHILNINEGIYDKSQ